MTSTQISIRTDVYEKLKQAKQENESFSEVIERLLDVQSNASAVIECYGIAKDNTDDEIADAYSSASKEIRAMFNAKTRLKGE
jgi:predicted CopG family antitoxin